MTVLTSPHVTARSPARRWLLGAAVLAALLAGCNKHPADQPPTPTTAPEAPAPATTPPPATPQDGTTPPPASTPPAANQ